MALNEKGIDRSGPHKPAAPEYRRDALDKFPKSRPSMARSLEEMLIRITKDIRIEQEAMDDLLTRLHKSAA